ncbi:MULTISPECIES: Lrp/AsnC family transcriptional regulator [unclassified Cryobacterium]|uniref:Lrp/AsnC family transcriptional regulator n=1 Tax=unclassified Cryobacterium TaxID=2649013 RepID=UPI00106DCC3A|nr:MULTISPECIES: Lrp/AsnC family transcriptional regulator [unclassified Cryobacterium]TFD07585.1 Lrp/AsnC family transcriptional regulator [Cryobacterium sp. TMT1-66-1]TFD14464.1 Lrp/AsnC family transcriptional regulator [Cryobacterium sp. TMT1-2-2]
MFTLDKIDLLIIRQLQVNARITNQELADAVGLSPSPCLRRVRRLEESGVISRYIAIVNPASVGLPITAFVRITLERHGQEVVEAVEDHIRSIPDIVEAHLLAGDHDYLLKVVTSSFTAYETLVRTQLRRIPALTSVETTFAFGTTKPLAPLPTD